MQKSNYPKSDRPRFRRKFNFRGNSRKNFRNSRNREIDYSKYIKKANPKTAEEYINKYKFKDFEIQDSIKEAISNQGYITPTPIQDQSIPEILAGKDVIGLAGTGTGKTISFLVPLVDKYLKLREKRHYSNSLIIAPTRELAVQIEKELFKVTTRDMKIFSLTCVGGTDIRRQIRFLKKPTQFVIGTPGRLKDLVERGVLDLSKFENIVLDEVDRMFDMGFIDDIEFLIGKLPEKRQSLFFSATLDKRLERTANEFLKDPITITVQSNDSSDSVHQDIIKLKPNERKVEVLADLLEKDHLTKTLIFCQTKKGVEDLLEDLLDRGLKADSIHGDKTQGKRTRALNRFRKGFVDILIATDVAARGIDVPKVSHVINYEIPLNYEDYIHRIGRTGRGGEIGHALTFVN